MAFDVQPGTTINVTVTRTPTNEAAAKTLSRLFAKAPGGRKLRQRRKKLRHGSYNPIRRGGRIWVSKPKAPRLIQPEKGAACTILATVDVIGDLGSVQRFIQVQPARG